MQVLSAIPVRWCVPAAGVPAAGVPAVNVDRFKTGRRWLGLEGELEGGEGAETGDRRDRYAVIATGEVFLIGDVL